MLKQELENFQDLLEEDPDCKWALYTKVLIMKTIDPAKYHQEIVKDFDMLCQNLADNCVIVEDSLQTGINSSQASMLSNTFGWK